MQVYLLWRLLHATADIETFTFSQWEVKLNKYTHTPDGDITRFHAVHCPKEAFQAYKQADI